MKPYWLSWCSDRMGEFELHWPWWVSGYDANDRPVICAAVIAFDERDAWGIIKRCHDDPKPESLDERFCEEKPEGWQPFCERFAKADWMLWPNGLPVSPLTPGAEQP